MVVVGSVAGGGLVRRRQRGSEPQQDLHHDTISCTTASSVGGQTLRGSSTHPKQPFQQDGRRRHQEPWQLRHMPGRGCDGDGIGRHDVLLSPNLETGSGLCRWLLACFREGLSLHRVLRHTVRRP